MHKPYTLLVVLAILVGFGQLCGQSLAGSVRFTENKGQIVGESGITDASILYTARLNGATAYITRKGINYIFNNKAATYRLGVEWQGAAEKGTSIGEGHCGYENFYLSHCPQGITGVKTYEKVVLYNIYQGIDVVLYDNNGLLEYDFVVQAGSNPYQIKINYKGADAVFLSPQNELIIKTPLGNITEAAPVSYQKQGEIKSKYVIAGTTVSFGFDQGFDPCLKLTIDPVIKIWGTYYGGTKNDEATSVFTDIDGNVYLGGNTFSDNVIALNGHQNTRTDNCEAFVAKFNKDGKRLWATYYGGENIDRLTKITPYSAAGFYLCGTTQSDTLIAFGGHQTQKGGKGNTGDKDAFLVKFDSSGVRFWATYFGGYGDDLAYGCAVGTDGDVYLSGSTTSPTGIGFNGFLNSYNDDVLPDAFLAKFDRNGILRWATYYGGLFSHEYGIVATGPAGEVYLAGHTESSTDIAENGHKNTFSGVKDAFIVKFNSNGNRIWGTYFGGTEYDDVKDITTDGEGNLYFTGLTYSKSQVANGGYRNTIAGLDDIYITKADSGGTPVWSTYYGGYDDDEALKIVTDNKNNVYVSGKTRSTAGISFGQAGNTLYGSADAFVVKYTTNGILDWGMYVGGDAEEDGFVAIDTAGLVYLCGTTTSSDIAKDGHQNTKDSATDAYLVKFSPKAARLQPIAKQQLCPGENFRIDYTVIAQLDTANAFTAYLSDSVGEFSKTQQAIALDKNYLQGTDSFTFNIPENLPPGFNYKVRIISSIPADTLISSPFTVKPKPDVRFFSNDTVQCRLGNLFGFTDSTDAAIDWLWDFGDNTQSTLQKPTHSYTSSGIYKVALQARAANNCINSNTLVLKVLPSSVSGFTTNNVQMCLKGNKFEFTDTSKGTIVKYGWHFGETGTANPDTTANAVKTYAAAGTYVVWHTVVNDYGCTDSTAAVVRVFPQPDVPVIQGNSFVLGRSSEVYQVTASPGTFYSWWVQGGTLQSGNGTPQINVVWDNGPVGKLRVVATTVFGCVGDTIEFTVGISPVGVNEIATKYGVAVYPNPAKDIITIVSTEAVAQVICRDVSGRTVPLQLIEGNTYNTASLANGFYTVEVIINHEVTYFNRLIKQ